MKLEIHNLKPAKGAKRSKKRVGRGNASGSGTTAGRGSKGQKARSGGSKGLKIKGFKAQMQATPKLGGFRSIHVKPTEVYLSDLEKHFALGDVVNLKSLQDKGVINKRDKAAKIINSGELNKKLTVEGIACSAQALEKIKKAGGEVK